jgi:hypothetical protein
MGSALYPFELFRPAPADQRALLEKYPLFFRAIHWPPIYRCPFAQWGIECGQGWYSLIDDAAAKVESELKGLLDGFHAQHHLRWLDKRLQNINMALPLDEAIGEDEKEPLIPFCAEVKERMGVLRIYLRGGHICDGRTWLRIRAAVDEAQRKSETTCERCGRPGFMRHHVWERVCCDTCFAGMPLSAKRPGS